MFQENDVPLNPIRGDLKFIDYEIKKKNPIDIGVGDLSEYFRVVFIGSSKIIEKMLLIRYYL